MKAIRISLVIIVCLLGSFHSATAGSSQNSSFTSRYSPEEIIAFAKTVEKTLAARKTMVAIVGRVGRPQSTLPEGIRFTHTAFWVYSQIQTEDGTSVPGYAVYNLYQRSKQLDRSDLIEDFPVDFMLGVYDLKVGIIIPTPALQKRLLAFISSPAYRQLHNPQYSAIANPASSRYQNCTEFVLNAIFASIYKTTNLPEIKQYIHKWFTPQPVAVSQLTLALGSVFMPDIKTDDHKGKPMTATFSTIAQFMGNDNLAEDILMLPVEATRSGTGNQS